MTRDQVAQTADGRVVVTFDKVPIELPPVVAPSGSTTSTTTAPPPTDLVGISTGKAAAWAKLAARDWSDYVANRTARR